MGKWTPLVVLSLAQFLMVIDQAVMNVSISQLVEDFDTTVTAIQGVITFYALTMAMLMVTGGKVGDILGRRRAFAIGHLVYAAGSALTAASWSVGSLLVGWSILEGVGAALVLPALVALVASNYSGRDRVAAFGVIGGVAGAGIAVGPIVGGFFTANLSWRWVFVGEVVLALVIIALVGLVRDAPVERRPRLDIVGAVIAGLGLGLVVVGALQSSDWGWLRPRNSPVEPFGFSITLFVIAAGLALLWAFTRWQEHRVRADLDPLVDLRLLGIAPLRAGLGCFLAQSIILLGVFFTLPLYFQVVLGFDALATGLRMLPISVAMLLASASGPVLASRFSPRRIVRTGFVTLVVAALLLLGRIDTELAGVPVAVALAVLGIGMGLIASQLGNVVQSAVEVENRGEAGGLQYTAQQLGSALGTALIGAIVLGALVTAFVDGIESDDEVPLAVTEAISVAVNEESNFVPAAAVEDGLRTAGVAAETTDRIVQDYEAAQLQALKLGLLVAAFIALGSLVMTRHLPAAPLTDRPSRETSTSGPGAVP